MPPGANTGGRGELKKMYSSTQSEKPRSKTCWNRDVRHSLFSESLCLLTANTCLLGKFATLFTTADFTPFFRGGTDFVARAAPWVTSLRTLDEERGRPSTCTAGRKGPCTGCGNSGRPCHCTGLRSGGHGPEGVSALVNASHVRRSMIAGVCLALSAVRVRFCESSPLCLFSVLIG